MLGSLSERDEKATFLPVADFILNSHVCLLGTLQFWWQRNLHLSTGLPKRSCVASLTSLGTEVPCAEKGEMASNRPFQKLRGSQWEMLCTRNGVEVWMSAEACFGQEW